MTTLLDEPVQHRAESSGNRLRASTAAIRLSFTWFGTRKTLTPQQKAQAADTFGAEGEFLSAGKKLIDTKHPDFKAVTSVRGRIVSYWRGISLPYPEPGMRLIRQDDVGPVNKQLMTLKADLQEAVDNLDRHFASLKSAARERLGSLYNSADYPDSLKGLFDVTWDFPSVEPPSYLQRLSPDLYEQECRRVTAQFDEAVQLAEQAFLQELSQLVSHLSERLSGTEDGKPKVFRDSVVENLTEFFERFRRLNVRSNDQLDEVIEQAQRVVRGVEPQALRDNVNLRNRVTNQFSSVQSVVDGLLVDRPRRNILRSRPSESA
jgi:hypothetical protein